MPSSRTSPSCSLFPKKGDVALSIDIRITRLLKIFLTTAVVISVYGVLEHFGIDKDLWVQDVQSRVFSTLGQPNWLAAYLVALVPVALALALATSSLKSVPFWTWMGTALLFFLTLLFTRSRSGYVGLFVADVAFWLTLLLATKKFKPIQMPIIVFHGLAAIIVFANGLYIPQIDSWITFSGLRDRITKHQTATPPPKQTTGTALETGGTQSTEIRKYVWQGAINAWRGSTKNLIVGTGTETYAFAFYRYRPVGHNMTSEWDFLYNKAHNEFLNYLATTGAFGLGSYLLLLGSFVFWFFRHRQQRYTLSVALLSGWLSILVTNFFGFSVVIMQLLLFLFPALTIALAQAHVEKRKFLTFAVPISATFVTYGRIIIGLATIALLTGLYRFWKADTLYASGNRFERSGQHAQAQKFIVGAQALNPGEPVYHDELGSVLAALALSAAQEKNATLAATLAKQSLEENSNALAISPHNVNFWKTRTKLYYTFSSFDPTLNAAATGALEQALTLSPNDPKIYYNLAILYGRDGNNKKALELLAKAKELKPNYRDAYFGLYVFHTDLGNAADAKAILKEYLDRVDPTDQEFTKRLNE